MDILIRNTVESDFNSIVDLNESEVEYTSPMNIDRLRELDQYSSFHMVAEVRDTIVAFLLAMREDCSYHNENYEWFSVRYSKFLYIDRIVVHAEFSGLRIGSMLYKKIFDYARSSHVPAITCEYNIVPPNTPSGIFHEKLGFREVGTQWLDEGSKQVSMKAAKI